MQDEDSSLCNDNASLSILRPSISKELLVENELIKQQDEEANNVQLPLFKDVPTNVAKNDAFAYGSIFTDPQDILGQFGAVLGYFKNIAGSVTKPTKGMMMSPP